MYPSTSKNSRLNNGFQIAHPYLNNVNQSISSGQNNGQFCQNCKNYNLGSVNFSLCNECEDNFAGSQNENLLNDEPDELKLMEIAAKVVAQHYPFQFIEERYERIPEPVQRRIIWWSFPRNENSIKMYSSLNSDDQKVSFRNGERMLEKVHNVLQVGFHLSGNVLDNLNSDREPLKKHRVSITFDRCKITSVTCSCDLKDIFWCPHVVALALYRIRRPIKVKLRVAISETLLQLDKCQLQKLVQFLISEHHTEVLPTAQSLADKMLNRNSILNVISGAPDPTAGAAIEQENCWALDEQQITKKVATYLNFDNYDAMSKHINALFGKVKEMLKARDSNASRMLSLITEQFLSDRRLVSWRTQGEMSDEYRQLWDQLVALWVYIALNPHATAIERKKISDLLFNWIQYPNCPLEDLNYRLNNSPLKRKLAPSGQISDDENLNAASDEELLPEEEENVNEFLDNNNNFNYNERRRKSPQNNIVKNKRKKKRYQPRTIFHRALEASFLKWDDPHLKFIIYNEDEKMDKNENAHMVSNLTNHSLNKNKNAKNVLNSSCSSSSSHQSSSKLFNSQGFPLWNEPIPIACARVEALRCHGYQKSAVKLAVSIVRSMKRKQRESLNMHPSQSDVNRNTIHYNLEGYIGNPLDSISTLFDTLAEASLTQDSKPLEHYYGMFLGDFNSYSIINGNNLSSSSPLEVSIPSFITDHHEPTQRIIENNNQRNSSQSAFREKPRYLHKAILGCHNRDETYISLALEAALIGLGQQRLMPNGEYLQEKSLKQEERLIAKLNDIEYDATLLAVLRNQSLLLLEGGPYSGFGLGIHPESVPMHKFAKFLFTLLLHYDNELAYLVGLRAMRLPILEGFNNFYEDLNNNNNLMNNNHLNRLNGFHNHLHHPMSNFYQNLNNNHLYPFFPNNPQMPMNNPLIYNRSNNGSNNNSSANANGSNWNRWHVLSTIEQQQCQLATTMIYAARNDFGKLKKVQTEAQKHIHTSTYLFKLAQDAFKIAIPIDNTNSNNNLNSNTTGAPLNILQTSFPRSITNSYSSTFNLGNLGNLNLSFAAAAAAPNFPLQHNHHNLGQSFKNNTNSYLLEVAFELGLQVIKMTQSHADNKRKEIVKWLVSSAIEIGFSALYYLMQFWYNLFTPIEAVYLVACYIMNPNMITKVNLIQSEQESLGIAARQLAVDCTKKDPPNCALHALGLCESDPLMFEKCYSIVEEAGIKNKMNFQQLINVAKHIESKGCLEWAYKLSQLAIKTIQIGYNNDSSPMIADIHWACSLALSLGKEQLSKLIPILIENIHCAQVLSDILRRCTTNSGLSYTLPNTTTNSPHSNHHQTNQFNSYPYLMNSNSFSISGTNHQHTNHQFSNHHSSSRRHHHSHHLNNSNKMLTLDKDPLKPLLDAAINCYVSATHSKLHVISPRHYSDFVEFLVKAQETFLLASDGEIKFNSLIDTIRTTYKERKS